MTNRGTLSDIQIVENTLGQEVVAGRTIEATITREGDIKISRIEEKHEKPQEKTKPTLQEKTEIGRGGMGIIFSVKQKTLGRDVALKELRPELMTQEFQRDKFLEEAVIIAQIEHPHVPPTYHLDTQRCRWTMKKIKGKTLEDILDESHDIRQIIKLLIPVCDALSCAHSKGVIHRDIKPENIMVGEYGEIYVMDWGIARIIRVPEQPEALQKIRERRKEENGMIAGTPKYMAPEQANGEIFKVDERSDIYALGCIIYEAMTGKIPINADSVMTLLAKKTNPNTKIKRPRINKELAEICMKSLQFHPEARYQTVTRLREDLQRCLDNEKVSVYDYNSIERLTKWVQNNTGKTIGALGLAGALIATSIGVTAYVNLQAQKAIADTAEITKKLAEKERDQAQIQTTLAEKEKNLTKTLAEKAEIAKQLAEKERDRAQHEKNTAETLAEKAEIAKQSAEKERASIEKEIKGQQQCEAILGSIKFLTKDEGYYEAALLIIKKSIAASEDYWKPYLVLARHYLEFEHYENAEKFFEKANEMYKKQFNKDSLEILFESGMCYGLPAILGGRGLEKKALDYLEKAYATGPTTTFGKLSNAAALIIKAEFDQGSIDKYLPKTIELCKELSQDIIAKNIDKTWLILAWAQGISVFREYYTPAFLKYANLPEARNALLHVVDENTGDINTRSFLAAIYTELGKHDKAIQIYSNILQIKKTAYAYTCRAVTYYGQGNLEKALEDYTRAIEIDPEYAVAYTNRGLVHESQNQLEKAVQDYSKAVQINPKDASAHHHRERAYQIKKESEERIDHFTHVIMNGPKKGPDIVWAYFCRGIARSHLGCLDAAIQDYTDAIKADPKYAPAYQNRGVAYEKKGVLKKALQDYTQAIKLEPKNDGAYLNRGNVYQKNNELKKAKQDYITATQINPKCWRALINLADISVNEGYLDEALDYYRRVLEYVRKDKDWKEKISRYILGIEEDLKNR